MYKIKILLLPNVPTIKTMQASIKYFKKIHNSLNLQGLCSIVLCWCICLGLSFQVASLQLSSCTHASTALVQPAAPSVSSGMERMGTHVPVTHVPAI